MKMKAITLLILLIVFTHVYAEDKIPELVAYNIRQLESNLKYGYTKTVEKWPEGFSLIRKQVAQIVMTKEDHRKVLATIPKNFLGVYKLGTTIETDKWIVTALDDVGVNMAATRKGDNCIVFGSVW